MCETVEQAMSQIPEGAKKTVALLDGISSGVGKLASWFVLPMVFSIMYEVLMRNAFTAPSIWALDVAMTFYGIYFMLGSPYCLLTGNHIRTDFFYHAWSVRKKAVVDIINYIVFLIPSHIVFLDIAWRYAYKSFMQNETSITSPWMPIIWPIKMAIPICVLLTLVQAVSEILKNYYRYKTGQYVMNTEQLGEAQD